MAKILYRSGSGSSAAIWGHPLHPMLVPLVIGVFFAAWVSDAMHFHGRDPFWARSAAWLLLATGITGIAAAVPGLIELLSVPRARSLVIGWVHGVGNALFVALAFVNYAMRRPDPVAIDASHGLILSSASLVLLLITGWLGGEMSYRHGVGVSRRVGGQSSRGMSLAETIDERSDGRPEPRVHDEAVGAP